MNPTQEKPKGSTRKKYNSSDIILFLLGIFLLLRTPWGNMNSFYTLLIVLYVFCIMLRISNIRKQYMKRAAAEKAEAEKSAPASITTADSTAPAAETEVPVTETEAPADRNENTPQA